MDLQKHLATVRLRTARRNHQRRGSMYVVVLGTAMIATVIGLSALYLVRIERRAAQGANEQVEARGYAQSAIEIGFLMIRADPAWRDNLGSGYWAAKQPIGNGAYVLLAAVIDDGDGQPDNDPVVLTGIGVSGRARHGMQVTIVSQSGGMIVSPGTWKQVPVNDELLVHAPLAPVVKGL